ncbi:MAG: putative Ig domain-containing protein, partial [Candidatus Poseidoniaceae archaeon]
AYLNITVNDEAPVISYSTTEITGTIDVALSPHVGPTTSGGTITSWEISPDPGSAFHFNSNNGYISGTPSILLSRTQYTIWANNSGGSSVAYVNVTINDVAPGPFEYNPENNTLTNNTYVHLAPQFINQTTGNGSTWQVADIRSGGGSSNPGYNMAILVGDTFYFSALDGSSGYELWAHDTSNASTWQVADIYSGAPDSNLGHKMGILVGDTLYFDATDGSSGIELWAHDTSNASTWRVADINSGAGNSNPGYYMHPILVGDTFYFDAEDGSSGRELWAHDTSNASTWRVADINSGAGHSYSGQWMGILVGDTLYFDANDGSSGGELWAHDTSNASTWRVADINSGTGHGFTGQYMSILVGDTLYFDATDGSSGRELWAHDTSNASTWRVADINSGTGNSAPGYHMSMLVGDTLYFDAEDGSSGRELWAHDTSNASTWRVADINSGAGHSYSGQWMGILVGDTLYFDANDGSSGSELWAHDTSNASTWRVADINSGTGDSNPGQYMETLVGDTLYFSADDGSSGIELWAHDTSNASTWRVADINSGTGSSDPYTHPKHTLVGDTLYFGANDGSSLYSKLWAHDTSNASTWEVDDIITPGFRFALVGDTLYLNGGTYANQNAGVELWAHRPSTIGYNTNTGGNVTTWAINASLPNGLSFGTNNGTIYGTPTELWTQTSYMVWANNSGGSSVAYLNITVVDELPTLSYSPSTLVLTINNESSDLPLNATLTGSGTITSWAINATLPAGLNFGTSNGTIWGIPTVLQTTATTYTIWANNSGGSSSFTITLTINDEAPGPFEYNPENNTWTNNSYVNIGPSFINETSGNGSTWQVADIQSGQSGSVPPSISYGWRIVVDDTVYFTANDGITGYELWAYNTSNGTTWQAADINSGSGSSLSSILDVRPMAILVGETIYFSADDGSSGVELWAHNTSSHSTWRVADIRSGSGDSQPGKDMYVLIGDILVFDATDYYNGRELWTHNTATNSTSRVTQLASGSAGISAGTYMLTVVGSRVYFDCNTGTSIGWELYAYDTTNTSAWLVADINSGSDHSIPGYKGGAALIGDTLYFSAEDGSTGDELWAHDTSNHSTWQVADINSGASDGLSWKTELAGDTVIDGVIYFTATDGNTGHELWAHSTSNGTTWQVADINSGPGNSDPMDRMGLIISGDTFYFNANDGSTGDELWAHDTSNRSTWRVTDLNSGSGDGYGWTLDVIGDTLYFIGDDGSTGDELWAYDTSNQSTWLVYDIYTGPNNSRFGDNWLKEVLVGNHLVFTADDGSTGEEFWAHYPSSINYQTNTGGNVTTWAINASLPSGLFFGTNNGTIYGTPTELWTQTSYMVWANNSGGSSVAYLNITVVDEVPTLSYSPSTLVLTINNRLAAQCDADRFGNDHLVG